MKAKQKQNNIIHNIILPISICNIIHNCLYYKLKYLNPNKVVFLKMKGEGEASRYPDFHEKVHNN